MSLIIRLQGLPAVADSFDVRQFFCGLSIPRGGVYITGGKYGEAYIVFATYEDARYALCLSGRPLKESCVHLRYSTEEEMRQALEVYQIGLKPSASGNQEAPAGALDKKHLASFSYIYIHGMAIKATKVDVREFFRGLLVEDVLFLKFINGVRNGNAIVKFGRSTDANEGVKLNNLPLCGSPVTLKLSNDVEWEKHGGEHVVRKPRSPPPHYSYERRRSRSRSPRRRRSRSRSPRRRRSRSRSLRWRRSRSRSPRWRRSRSRSPSYRRRRRSRSRTRSRSRSRGGSPYVREYYVHLINVSYRADKKAIKKFFYDLDMEDSQINFLLDKEGKRTREAFVMFTTEKDYRRARALDREVFKSNTLTILPITKEDMLKLIDRMKVRVCKDRPDGQKSPSRSTKERRYLYLRNFACNVTKADVQKFFTRKNVKEDDICLLEDNKGVGLGEALVKFADDKEASRAEKENSETHLGNKIVLSRITEAQMRALQECNELDEAIVTEADDPADQPDFTSDSLPTIESNVEPPPEQSNGEPAAPESTAVEMPSETETAPALGEEPAPDKEPAPDEEPKAEAGSDLVQETPMTQENPTEDGPEDANGCNEEIPFEVEETKKSEVTLLFVRNLPTSVTASEILDFFHDYKVSSVNLKNIERGIATVRMPSYAEAVSAIDTLNKKEVGLKQVFLSLF